MSIRTQKERLPLSTEKEYFNKHYIDSMLGAVIDQYQGKNHIASIPRYKKYHTDTSRYDPHQGKQECARRR